MQPPVRGGNSRIYPYGPEVPVQGRDANLVHVWAVLGEDGVIKLSKDAIRIESSDAICRFQTKNYEDQKNHEQFQAIDQSAV